MVTKGNCVSPKGFKAAGGHCGLKAEGYDLAIVTSDYPCVSAGTFTRNVVKAAPVTYDMAVVASGKAVRGIIVNSKNANACTGEQGERDAAAMADALSAITGGETLVCSTGVIGVPMPIGKVTGYVPTLAKQLNDAQGGEDAARAIMTTDTFPKTGAVTVDIGGKTVTIGGMAKGSGMIHPDMATLLGFITTDAAIEKSALQAALSASVDETYNCVSVDGDTSTNDTILALANGAAGNDAITADTPQYAAFAAALLELNRKLAMDVARDGEGATKLLECRVNGAGTAEDAKKLAKSIISSSLFKAAMFGADANFGRALCAMGYSGGAFDPYKTRLAFKSLDDETRELLVYDRQPVPFDEGAAKALLSGERILIEVTLSDGGASATAWGCDLTYDYVKINGDYRS